MRSVSDLLWDWFGDMPQVGCLSKSCSPPGEACASATMCAELAADWGPVGGVGIAGGGGKTANQSSVSTPAPVFARSFCETSLSTSTFTSTHRQFGSPLCNPLHMILHRSPTGCSITSSCRHLWYPKGTPWISTFLVVLGRAKAPSALWGRRHEIEPPSGSCEEIPWSRRQFFEIPRRKAWPNTSLWQSGLVKSGHVDRMLSRICSHGGYVSWSSPTRQA